MNEQSPVQKAIFDLLMQIDTANARGTFVMFPTEDYRKICELIEEEDQRAYVKGRKDGIELGKHESAVKILEVFGLQEYMDQD